MENVDLCIESILDLIKHFKGCEIQPYSKYLRLGIDVVSFNYHIVGSSELTPIQNAILFQLRPKVLKATKSLTKLLMDQALESNCFCSANINSALYIISTNYVLTEHQLTPVELVEVTRRFNQSKLSPSSKKILEDKVRDLYRTLSEDGK